MKGEQGRGQSSVLNRNRPPPIENQHRHRPNGKKIKSTTTVSPNSNFSSPDAIKPKILRNWGQPNHARIIDTTVLNQNECIVFLNLFGFKLHQCTQDPHSHSNKKCPCYHDFKKDRRRPLGTYSSEMCQNLQGKNSRECPNGDKCEYAHNRFEEFYHPDKYKAKFCQSPNGANNCEYGQFCAFAHNRGELSVELIEEYTIDMDFYIYHFKTVWCPYKDDDHDRKTCLYAHNWQDFRRKPALYTYSSKMCPNWKQDTFIMSYTDGCIHQYFCGYSHGWKEQEYHPDFFKFKECKHGAACTKSHCPYYHNAGQDMRLQTSQWFHEFPKSRLHCFPNNFYLAQYGTHSNMMAYKQTSFSRLSTEIICNEARLTRGRGSTNEHSPNSFQDSNDSNTYPRLNQNSTGKQQAKYEKNSGSNKSQSSSQRATFNSPQQFTELAYKQPLQQYNMQFQQYQQQYPQPYQQQQQQQYKLYQTGRFNNYDQPQTQTYSMQQDPNVMRIQAVQQQLRSPLPITKQFPSQDNLFSPQMISVEQYSLSQHTLSANSPIGSQLSGDLTHAQQELYSFNRSTSYPQDVVKNEDDKQIDSKSLNDTEPLQYSMFTQYFDKPVQQNEDEINQHRITKRNSVVVPEMAQLAVQQQISETAVASDKCQSNGGSLHNFVSKAVDGVNKLKKRNQHQFSDKKPMQHQTNQGAGITEDSADSDLETIGHHQKADSVRPGTPEFLKEEPTATQQLQQQEQQQEKPAI